MIYVDTPDQIIKGAIDAIKEYGVDLTLVGRAEEISPVLKREAPQLNIPILSAATNIGFDEEPVKAIRKKKDSSIVIALNKIKDDPDSTLVSAGSTGALLAGATFLLGRIKGVKRPGLGVYIPQKNKQVFLMDAGASSEALPGYLETYAKISSIYLQNVDDLKDPKIGLINIGTEAEKGSPLYKEAYELLEKSGLNFIGNVEPKDILTTEADALVCDGFTGNIIIKTIEGLSSFLFKQIKASLMGSFAGKVGALLVRNDLTKLKKTYDSDEIGGSPFLGVKGGVIKAHGSSKAYAIKNAINQARLLSQKQVVKKLMEELS